ncbi:pyridoxamine 5'-phosphate oxidase family protein [Haloferax sp. YSSS75]|uniref:pyridoxamine 5'-phosphate oxidase family protein n=1 Tax=Haloferax sp. YSSS75 TaxID=3388564 RepID=UPI00398C91E5
MTRDSPENRSEDVRLSPRAVEDDEWIEAFLIRQPTCVVGLVDDGAPYVVNQLFVFDPTEHAIFLHGAMTGRMRTIVERGESADASLTVSRMGRLLPAEKPVDFDVEYASVVAYGDVELVEGSEQKRRALDLLMEKFAPHLNPGDDYDPIAESSIDRTSVYRIDIEGWSAKRNEQPADAAGAYAYRTVREEGR